jgi:hypothetical protein
VIAVVGVFVLQACYTSTFDLASDSSEGDVIDRFPPPDTPSDVDGHHEVTDVGVDVPADELTDHGSGEDWTVPVDDVSEFDDGIEDLADDGWDYDVPVVCDPPFGPSGLLAYAEDPGPPPLDRRGEVRVVAHRGPIGDREYELDLEWADGARGTLTYRTPDRAEERLPVEPGSTWQGWLRTDGRLLVLGSPNRLLAFQEAEVDLAGPSDLQGWSLFSVPPPCDFVAGPCGAWRSLALGIVPPDLEDHDPVYPGNSLWFRTRDGDVWLVFGSGFELEDASCPGEPARWIEYLLRVERTG